MSKLIIVEGNSNDKDNVRAVMVKGEAGNDGTSPTVAISKSNGVTTITITDIDGTKTATINDGEISQATLNTTLDNRVGVNSNLTTTEKGTIVGAINEVNQNTTNLSTNKQNVVLSGTSDPTSSLGVDGDIYLQYS